MRYATFGDAGFSGFKGSGNIHSPNIVGRLAVISMPTLIIHAKDDKLASYSDTEKAVKRFLNCTFVSFEDGEHLLKGHGEEIKKAVSKFTKEQ